MENNRKQLENHLKKHSYNLLTLISLLVIPDN